MNTQIAFNSVLPHSLIGHAHMLVPTWLKGTEYDCMSRGIYETRYRSLKRLHTWLPDEILSGDELVDLIENYYVEHFTPDILKDFQLAKASRVYTLDIVNNIDIQVTIKGLYKHLIYIVDHDIFNKVPDKIALVKRELQYLLDMNVNQENIPSICKNVHIQSAILKFAPNGLHNAKKTSIVKTIVRRITLSM